MPFARIDDATFHYQIDGKGEPLMLLSGLNADLTTWAYQESILKKNYRVIRFDNRGVGKTICPTGSLTIPSMAKDAIMLLDHLGLGTAHIIGHSMGGMIAQEMAIRYPERIQKVILISTFSCREGRSGLTEEGKSALTLSTREQRKFIIKLAFNKPFNRLIIRCLQPFTSSKGWEAAFDSQLRAVLGFDSSKELGSINKPVLVMTGTTDRLVRPSSSDYIARLVVGARLIAIENGSHCVHMESSRRVTTIIQNFLGATDKERAIL